MDATETLVKDHLVHRGHVNIVYEPDGNIPPDFLVDSRVAVEVRRLNQNHFDGNYIQGLEEVAIPLWKRIQRLLDSMGPPTNEESWFVHFNFSRPVESWKSLEPKLRGALSAFLASPGNTPRLVSKGLGFELEVFCRASKLHPTAFVMAGCSDRESGGWLLSEMEKNIRDCAREKAQKIAKFKPRYSEWWLALVDYIGFSLGDLDRELFRAQVSIEHSWDKIILIDPRDFRRWFEL